MNATRVLVAGIGNIFFGDDAFGSVAAQRLAERPLRPEVRVVDFGIRSYDLAYALMDDYELAILIDATPRGGEPGTVYLIEPDLNELDRLPVNETLVDTHTMQPVKVLQMVKMFGGTCPKLQLVGCEPADLGPPNEGKLGLSPAVTAAIEPALAIVESLLVEHLASLGSPAAAGG